MKSSFENAIQAKQAEKAAIENQNKEIESTFVAQAHRQVIQNRLPNWNAFRSKP